MKFVERRKILSEIGDCTFSPHNKLILSVQPGEEVKIETYDCFANAVKPDNDLAQVLQSGAKLLDNPVTGPIYVEGAKKGDTLVVDIIDIEVPESGLTAVMPGFGALEGWLAFCCNANLFIRVQASRSRDYPDRA